MNKKLIVYTTGITPIDCRGYYDTYVLEKNFKPHMLEKIKIFISFIEKKWSIQENRQAISWNM